MFYTISDPLFVQEINIFQLVNLHTYHSKVDISCCDTLHYPPRAFVCPALVSAECTTSYGSALKRAFLLAYLNYLHRRPVASPLFKKRNSLKAIYFSDCSFVFHKIVVLCKQANINTLIYQWYLFLMVNFT